MSGRTAAVRSVGGQSVGGQSVGGQSVGGESVGGQSVGGQSVGGESVGGQSGDGQSVGGQSGSGDAILAALRPPAGRRPAVDPGLAGGLRAWLEDGVAPVVAHAAPGGAPLIVDRWSLTAVSPVPGSEQAYAPRATIRGAGPAEPSTLAGARQAMVSVLFRQLVTVGVTGRPFDDALAGLRMTTWGADLVALVSSLPRGARDSLRRDLAAHAQSMAAWPSLPAGWLPQTTAHRLYPLAGGRVLLRATMPLLLGAPPIDRASTCVVDIRAGEPLDAHAGDRHLLALVETLCSGAPPCRVVTYYPRTGQVDVLEVDEAALGATLGRVIEAVRRLGDHPGSPAERPAVEAAPGTVRVPAVGAAAVSAR